MTYASDETWNIGLTQELLMRKPVRNHIAAYKSVFSVIDRMNYARYHYQQVATPWASLLEHARSAENRWRILGWGVTDEERDLLEHAHIERSANVVACVHTLHAVPDTLAFALVYCLDLSLPQGKGDRDITVKRVISWLGEEGDTRPFKEILREITTAPNYLHLEALSNHGKHRSIIADSMSADTTGKDTVPLRLRFASFSYNDGRYESVDVLPFLSKEFDRITSLITKVGILLNAYLTTKPDRPKRTTN